MEKVVLIRSFEFLILISLFSCTRNDTVTLPITTIEITVEDGNSWNISDNTMDVVNGATIRLYKSETDIMNNIAPEYTAITSLAGKASLMVEYKREYFFTVKKGNATNIVNGLLITGIFQSQSEINTSPVQIPAPTIGAPKFLDTNGDGIITSPYDNVFADYIEVVQNQTNTKTSIIYQ